MSGWIVFGITLMLACLLVTPSGLCKGRQKSRL
jgi:hypothetical protein